MSRARVNVVVVVVVRQMTEIKFCVAAGGSPERVNGYSAVRRLRRTNSRKMAVAGDGSVLAQWLPQVLVLRHSVGRNRPVLLHQKRHDPLQERLQTVSRSVR